MTEKELRTWMRRESLSDAWHTSAADGTPSPKALTLAGLHAQYANSAEHTLSILHESQLGKKNPAWVELDLDSFGSTTSSQSASASSSASSSRRRPSSSGKSSRRSSGRKRGLLVQISALLLVCIIGFGGWMIISTVQSQKQNVPVTEAEEISNILETLSRNLALNAASQDNQEDNTPVVRTVISATQHMLMVKNSNLEDWPSFRLNIILPNGEVYVCNFTQAIPAYSTLSISMRRITNTDGKPLSREMITSGTQLELEVPGYPKWSSAL